ncbi:hypothetical protein [Candidatus Frankia nodulisporulans]|uniref:hypothetical protein n=1 Tax=Candidatus Frankia nodulisporulans TaxID=2060052 RepID=UPI0013D2603F|nr:hypothetical protein [Candidatus Frankia nodulisporulans]
MASETAWEIADTIGDRARDWDGVVDSRYAQRRGPDDPAITTIIRADGRRYTITVTDLDT